ncbi:hypothetical protein [Metabacillus malikii]|uniref:Uncharacterized protein n=1 Tax=Metabacillus malikii TaxID=1504265 RepID=A0ABT9ZL98_9BACI|nr:hypothetical protein [Metabacillus malikii]MDQ0232669.1 hypothetical protein [Metabacillus malikii]
MRKGRIPILDTNIVYVALFCIIIAPLMGAVTESLKIFLGNLLTLPFVFLLLYILWLKYGYSGVYLNSINVFVMLTMWSVYGAVPLFSFIWGHWVGWLTILFHLGTFMVGFINREKLILGLNGKSTKGDNEPNPFILYYILGILILGIVGTIILHVTLVTSTDAVYFFGFIYLLSYCFYAISPAFLVHPDRALELGVISQRHYDEYN